MIPTRHDQASTDCKKGVNRAPRLHKWQEVVEYGTQRKVMAMSQHYDPCKPQSNQIKIILSAHDLSPVMRGVGLLDGHGVTDAHIGTIIHCELARRCTNPLTSRE